MMVIESRCKGDVHVFGDLSGGESTDGATRAGGTGGFYEIEGFPTGGSGSKALILGVPLNLQEIVQPSVTLDNKRTLYVFGSAWSTVTVTGILLLGKASTRGALAGELISWFKSQRVGTSLEPVSVSVGTAKFSAYVTGLQLGEANGNTNTQAFTISMLTPD